MERSLATYREQAAIWHAQTAKNPQVPIYFDRGIGDAFTCADLIGYTLSATLCEEATSHRYREPVFLAPWWPEIHITDDERRQSREEADRTEHAAHEDLHRTRLSHRKTWSMITRVFNAVSRTFPAS
jgi:predicted ATPase